jgi:hypothetical protein
MSEAKFSKVRDDFVILKLPLESYRESTRSLPPGYYLGPSTLNTAQRSRERQLLEINFPESWHGVSSRRTAGWRPTRRYVLKGDELVGGLYLCAEHGDRGGSDWGQLLLLRGEDERRRAALDSCGEAVRRAPPGAGGVFINSDRFGLPEVYQRWGATLWKVIPKANRPRARDAFDRWKWLVLTIHEQYLWKAIRRYARGELADIGCGEKPYTHLTRGIVTRHIGIDHEPTIHARDQVGIVATAGDTSHRMRASTRFSARLCWSTLSVRLKHFERSVVYSSRVDSPSCPLRSSGMYTKSHVTSSVSRNTGSGT